MDSTKVKGLAQVSRLIEATRLDPNMDQGSLLGFAREAISKGCAGICVLPGSVGKVFGLLPEAGERPDLVTVANFPTGGDPWGEVEACIVQAIRDGVDHIDVVAPLPKVVQGDWLAVDEFLQDIVALVRGISRPGKTPRPIQLKLILETASLDPTSLKELGAIGIEAGFDWLKTSTGMHPKGGATVAAVAMLRHLAPSNIRIKASGGIRTLSDLLPMRLAGADRIGTSSEVQILREAGIKG